MAKIAFLGLGAMGSRMARSLIAAGHEMTVWNRSAALARALADHGAMIASSPRAAATGADIVIAMLRDDQASRSVWLDDDDGALAGMSAGALAIECSTLTVAWARELAGAVHKAGHSFLDAPVVGSRPQAEGRQLIFLAGGAASDVERATPFFSAMGQATHHVGGNGCGSAVKLAVNALFAIQVAGMAELITMLKADGVDITRAVEVIGATSVASVAAKGAAASMLAGNFAPMFPVELVAKDLDYVASAVAAGRNRAPLSAATRLAMGEAIAKGFGNDNLTGVVRIYN